MRRTALVLLATAAVAYACGSTSRNEPPPGKPTADSTEGNGDAIADFLIHHRHHHHGGFLMLVTMSLDTLGLAPDERAGVEEIRSDLLAKMQPARAAELETVDLLATGIAQSFIDKTRVDAAIVNLGNASAVLHDATVNDLNRLHELLTPAERTALVEKTESHWRLWQMANNGSQSHVDALSKEIGLTHSQQEEVRKDFHAKAAASPMHESQVERHLRDFGRAFRGAHFDARQLTDAAFANRHMAEWGASRSALYCEVVNPVLTPEQRNRLVSILREHMTHDESQAGD